MIVRMLNSAPRASEDALHVSGAGRNLLDLPEERAMQFVAEGLRMIVPHEPARVEDDEPEVGSGSTPDF